MGKLFKRGRRWGIDYTDARGKRVRKVVAGDKLVAHKMLGDAVQAVEKVRAGVLASDPREAQRDLQAHVDAYLGDLQRRGRDGMYCYIVKRHLENAADEQGWECLADCTPRSVTSYLSLLSARQLSPKTINAHRADLAAFFGWCVRQGLVESNPCEQVGKTAVKREKTRRALSVAECRALLDASPPERRAAYLFLIYTGLRRAEAASLKWSHVHLDVANPYVEVPASIAKSGRRESVPLVPELAEALRSQRGRAGDGRPVFDEIPSMPDFRSDLAAANIEEIDVRGRKVVLHCLRHSLATMLATSGVPMVVAQRIMRHRDIKLTAEVYTDEGLLPIAAAMNALPSLTLGPSAAAVPPRGGSIVIAPGI